MEKLTRDKKFKSGKIRFVTLSEIGKAQVIETVTASDLETAIEHLRKGTAI
jgi:3-dehydroquinate synthetase